MNNVFVTGASGFIGKRLLIALTRMNICLRILSRVDQNHCETIVCDLQTEKIPIKALSGIDTVFHLAGFTHDIRNTNKIESLYRAINVNATVQLAELAATSGVQRFVFASSVKAGGSAVPGKCKTEEEQGDPEGIYGQTKREAELKIFDIGRQSGMHVSVVRPALVYGVGVKGNLHKMLVGIMKGRFPPLPDTQNKRSMVHVDDLVAALLLTAEKSQANGEIFNVTDDCHYSSRKIYTDMCLVLGKTTSRRVPVIMFHMVAKFGDLLSHVIRVPFDSERLQKLLGDECYSSNKIRTLLKFRSCYTLTDALPDMATFLTQKSG